MNATDALAVDRPEAILQHHARSFAWAARFLPRHTRRDAAQLYAFCRVIDDLADNSEPSAADSELRALREALLAAERDHPVAGPFLALAERRGLTGAAALNLIEGVRGDLGPVELATTAELIQYAYRVAGTVGLMMSPLLGVTEPPAAPFALDLGIAMQLTNIARDVVEDGERGRRYLPTDMLGGSVEPHRLYAPDPLLRHEAFKAVRHVLDTADIYYASAELGMRYIPRRPRLAIVTAARLYQAIGGRIRSLGPQDYWQTHAAVPAASKIPITLRATVRWLRPQPHDAPSHDPRLHRPIAGWPGSDPEADP